MSSKGTVVAMGLPASGKTTFLAALWHQLESAELSTAFTTDRLPSDREYLNGIREKWLGFEEIPRTSVGTERSLLMHLQHVETLAHLELLIPDVAGERFAAQWHDRRISRRDLEYLQTSLGLLLFMHCRQISAPHVLSSKAPDGPTGNESIDWSTHLAPTQVQLVDLLQTALDARQRKRTLRVAIIVSAWDEVVESTTPPLWLERKVPLLDQFCRANCRELQAKVFGVSAIGGNLADKETLAMTSSPSSRVRVHMDTETVRDLTLPLEFITLDKNIA